MIAVCHIITKLELGGAQQNTIFTVKHLDRRKFRPSLITNPDGLLVAETRQQPDLRAWYLSCLRREIRPHHDLHALFRIRAILRKQLRSAPHEPLIVHTHSSKAGILGRWAARLAGVRHIVHSVHGFGFHAYQPPLTRAAYVTAERLTAGITDHFIAVSQANIRTGVAARIFAEPDVSLIRSGIDITRFRQVAETPEAERQRRQAALRREIGIAADAPVVGMIACFKPQKAPLDFIRVMRRVADTLPNVQAVMAGDGVLRPQIEALIAERDLGATVTLLGWRDDIPELMDLCRVIVLTSRWEGLPRVCPQAMAVGRPIVAPRVDGIPEAVRHGETGFLVEPGDIQAMARHLIHLLSNPEHARAMGLAGQRQVAEFDIHRMVTQQEALYERLVARNQD